MEENENFIGPRLTAIRLMLCELTGQKWTQEIVAKEVGVTRQVVRRGEAGNITIQHLAKLMKFYYLKAGFNINWVLIDENEHIPMRFENIKTPEELKETKQKIRAFRKEGSKFHSMLQSIIKFD